MTQGVFDILNLLERELLTQKMVGGGSKEQTTEPYKHFEDTMNEIYDYVKFVFETNEKNKMEYSNSVKKMNKECNCDSNDYKTDKNNYMKPSINSSSIVFTLQPANRTDFIVEGSKINSNVEGSEKIKKKNEWIN
jgi:hypothetical protein